MEKWRDKRFVRDMNALIDGHTNEAAKLTEALKYFELADNDERKAMIKAIKRGKFKGTVSVAFLCAVSTAGIWFLGGKAIDWIFTKIDEHKKNNEQEESEEIEA